MNRDYNSSMSKQLKPDWTQRKNITLPAIMFEFVAEVADTRRLPLYQLVYEAVDLYSKVHPPIVTEAEPA